MIKIKKLFIEDFGVFKGKHEIEFAADEKNRITVIVGQNGTGKTTILNALKKAFEHKSFSNPKQQHVIENGKSS
tara:strand:- start:505 stop:726 length:222 start_codon:yes stop_codon:yes gene_type:complete